MMNHKIASLISSAAKTINDQQEMFISIISNKLQRAASALPQDKTIGAIATIVSKMEDNKKQLITRAELKSLYQTSYSHGTKFAEVFKDELGELAEKASAHFAEKNEEAISTQSAFEQVCDPILSNALASVFDSHIPLKMYSKDVAEKGKQVVANCLEVWNLKASKVEVVSGNEHFLVVQADYETPKGKTSVLVPVELQGNKVASPQLFMANAGPQELNYVSLRAYLSGNAGNKLQARASDVLAALTSVVVKTASGLNTVELALTKLNSIKEHAAPFFADSVMGIKRDEVVKNAEVSLPKAGYFESFAEKFASPLGYANMQFGADKVNLGRDVVLRSLASLGFKNVQLNIAGANETTIVYAVSINDGRLAFNVPIKFANNRILNPELLICNGTAYGLTKEGLRSLVLSNSKDYKAAAVTSAQYGLKPNELVDNVRAAMAEGNYAKAEDALNILAETNVEAYKIAFTAYTNGLSMTKQASASEQEVSCSMITKNANSEHELCGHTGLPLHKVYQDRHGHCQPLYRRAMEENYEGVSFTTKVLG